jgi:hypothetical protein
MGFLWLLLGLMNLGVRLGGIMPEIGPAGKAAGSAVGEWRAIEQLAAVAFCRLQRAIKSA